MIFLNPDEFSSILDRSYLFGLYQGEVSLEEYFQKAQEHRICYLFFIELVSKGKAFDYRSLKSQVKQLSLRYKIRGFVGVETCVLLGGQLDLPEGLTPEFITLSTQFLFKFAPVESKGSLINCFSDQLYRDTVRIWIDPESMGDDPDDYTDMAIVAKNNKVFIEWNRLAKKGVINSKVRTRNDLSRVLAERYCQMI